MNPLTKVRDAAGSAAGRARSGASSAASRIGGAPRRAWEGTTRTGSWVGGGVARGWERARGGVSGATGDARERIRDTAEAASDRSGGTQLATRARTNPRIAIGWAVGALLLVAWIAWAAYVTAENGANAGLGVLLSWPVVFGALALVAAPFVAAAVLVRRLRGGDGGPPIAGGADGSDSDAVADTYPG